MTTAEPTEPVRAAEVIARSPSGRVLMMNRTDGQGWGGPRGAIEEGETPDEAARRGAASSKRPAST
jgi:8-oxo-dGTP pyrophosphatase MutT (NUDIX family)